MLNRAAKDLDKTLLAQFAPFPKWGEEGWRGIDAQGKAHLIAAAEKDLGKDWPSLKATTYMQYHRNGNRTNYQNVYYARRTRVMLATIAECIEGKGRFMDDIIDGVWLICEETSWVIPAHNDRHRVMDVSLGLPLPDFRNPLPYIDLFSAETGSLLSWVHYFLAEQLEKVSPLLPMRIEEELKKRILDPYLHDDSMWWMGLVSDKPVNNWNPWINSNIQTAFLLAERDPLRRVEGLKKVARSSQRFLDFYAEDGGCDEGPSYFNVAGASLLDILEQFYDATAGKVNVYDQPLIRNMADYIRHAHIAGKYFVNFADAPCALGNVSAGCLIRAGRLTNNPDLVSFAKRSYLVGTARLPWEDFAISSCWKLFRTFKTLFTFKPEDTQPDALPAGGSGHYFSGIQVTMAKSGSGLFVAAKGGNNAESHNHNDIGNYVLYDGDTPCALDAGVGTYSRKTFSDERYTIWAMQSGWHNTAIVNGCDQKNGIEYAAANAQHTDDGMTMHFSLDMEKAYPAEANLINYRRDFAFDRAANTFTVTDTVMQNAANAPTALPILCYEEPQLTQGTARLSANVTLHYDAAQFDATVQAHELNDPENPITCWGSKIHLYRLLLTRKETKPQDVWSIRYEKK